MELDRHALSLQMHLSNLPISNSSWELRVPLIILLVLPHVLIHLSFLDFFFSSGHFHPYSSLQSQWPKTTLSSSPWLVQPSLVSLLSCCPVLQDAVIGGHFLTVRLNRWTEVTSRYLQQILISLSCASDLHGPDPKPLSLLCVIFPCQDKEKYFKFIWNDNPPLGFYTELSWQQWLGATSR